jgi:hypothetical protein
VWRGEGEKGDGEYDLTNMDEFMQIVSISSQRTGVGAALAGCQSFGFGRRSILAAGVIEAGM